MTFTRLNETTVRPNPAINFITPLPETRTQVPTTEDAMNLLHAIAAQIKPITRAHGFQVNSFEEFEFNKVFAGRNWNAGETIELVLRRANGQFYPTAWLLQVMAHELAHIMHMNHGPAFQKLNASLRQEIKALQAKGYFGDGLWSSGRALASGQSVAGTSTLSTGDFPEFECGGGLQRRAKRKRAKRARDPGTSVQPTKQRKAGSRVRADIFPEGGTRIDGTSVDEKGSNYRKRMNSKSSRQARAEALEKRLAGLQDTLDATHIEESTSEEEAGVDMENDADRRRLLLDHTNQEELDHMRIKFEDWLTIPSVNNPTREAIEISDSDGEVNTKPSLQPLKTGKDSSHPPPPSKSETPIMAPKQVITPQTPALAQPIIGPTRPSLHPGLRWSAAFGTKKGQRLGS